MKTELLYTAPDLNLMSENEITVWFQLTIMHMPMSEAVFPFFSPAGDQNKTPWISHDCVWS